MGCDIHSMVEVRSEDGTWHGVTDRIFPMAFPFGGEDHTSEPFDWRSYGMFAFLADVRNYSHVPPLDSPRHFPSDLSSEAHAKFDDDDEYHSRSWFSLDELLRFDYEQTFEDRRTMRDGNGAADAGVGNGKLLTFREFLGTLYFHDLDIMKALSPDPMNVRVVFCFDN